MNMGAWTVIERIIRTIALTGLSIVVVHEVASPPATIVALAFLFHGKRLVKWLPGLWSNQKNTDEPGALE
ncbi:hypothetical protein [Nocardia farcinica]|uniref:hypothetical protein n=1 Tax=Nocardia farcinica TaxID=37329 RepID=UPI0018942911|nr:hypothetical protein [Nocardia farcinica]MBF6290788.1 hypothetical protein [Nocardia farcinica]MBF6380340.1 hypothetical protein [Nocardia farcinica]